MAQARAPPSVPLGCRWHSEHLLPACLPACVPPSLPPSSSSSDSLESDSEGRGRGEIPFHFDYLDIDLSVSGRARGTLEYTCPGQEGTRKYWHLEAAAPHPLSLSRARPSNQRAVHSACVPGSTGSCAARRRLCLLHVDNAVAHWVARTLRARRAALCLGCDLSVHGSTV
eukprot:COSAG03_NODE_38_length_17530_cov_148.572223_7_plen_170_part_00